MIDRRLWHRTWSQKRGFLLCKCAFMVRFSLPRLTDPFSQKARPASTSRREQTPLSPGEYPGKVWGDRTGAFANQSRQRGLLPTSVSDNTKKKPEPHRSGGRPSRWSTDGASHKQTYATSLSTSPFAKCHRVRVRTLVVNWISFLLVVALCMDRTHHRMHRFGKMLHGSPIFVILTHPSTTSLFFSPWKQRCVLLSNVCFHSSFTIQDAWSRAPGKTQYEDRKTRTNTHRPIGCVGGGSVAAVPLLLLYNWQ